jgi:hypothetical protein
MSDDPILRVMSVRNRPVGLVAGRWGTSLVAVERGYFPVSQTGYRSLSGMAEQAVTAEHLESLANDRDRERQGLLRSVRSTVRPESDRITNYIHVSMIAEKTLHDGFFAPDAERAELWPAAHRLFCLIDTDARFQPAPTHVRWTEENCANALARTREARRFLERCAKGDFPTGVPMEYFAARAYLALPPKPGGEPIITLAGVTTELALDVVATTATRARTDNFRKQSTVTAEGSPGAEDQLGLFGPDGGAPPAPTVRTEAAHTPRRGISI